MQARRRTATLFAAVLLAAGCSGSTDDTAALPPPPPEDDTIDTVAAFPDDGLSRYIITPIAATGGATAEGDEDADGQASGEEDAGTAEGAAGEPGGSDGRLEDEDGEIQTLTPELMALVPDGAPLVQRDGRIGYLDDDGDFVALPTDGGASSDDSDLGPDPAAETDDSSDADERDDAEELEVTAAVSYGNPYIDELAGDPAVESVIVIGDGTYGVTVSDPSVIDPAVFAIAEDVPLGHTAETYEDYQWALENDGVSLQRVRPIDQLEDADLDVGPTLGRADGSGVVVAVIDSGVDFDHPDLTGSSWTNAGEICGNGIDDDGNGYVDDCTGWDFGNGDPNSFDPGANPHGTHVAGIITANRNNQGVAGIAPAAQIMDLNVGTRSAAGESISGASITAAIRYAVDNGAQVINLSLGTEPGTPAAAVAPMGAAIDYAASKGVVVVAAAGNHGVDLGSAPVYPASFNKPNMLVVGASSPSDTRADFSNHSADIVDLYAPGELILSTMPGDGYQFMSGTSQASPTTAASVALAIETDPDASMSQLIDTVLATVDRREALATSTTSGRLNSARTIGVEDGSTIPPELDVAVHGLREPSNDIAATVEIATPPDAFNEPYRWELTLVHSNADGAYAVVDHPMTIAGAALTTGEAGTVELLAAEQAEAVGVTEIEVAAQLPGGRYSFVMEAVPTEDPSFRLGDAFIASFEIPGDDDSTAITTIPVTTRPEAPSTTTDDQTGSDAGTGGGNGSGGTGGSSSTSAPAGTPTTTGGGQTGSTSGGGTSGPTPTTPGTSTTGGSGPGDGGTTGSDGGSGGTGGDSTSGSGSGAGTDTGSSTPTTSGGTSPTTQPTAGSGGGDGGSDDGGGDGSTTSPTSPDSSGSDTIEPPSGLGSGAAKKGAWESTSVEPQVGMVATANAVQIVGNFPSDTYVWFGDQPGQVVFQDRTRITVRTPPRAQAGIVDITLRKSHRGVVLTIPDAFAFVAGDDRPDDGSGTGGSTDTGDPGAGSGGTGDPGTGSGGGDDTGSTDGTGGDTTGGDGPTDDPAGNDGTDGSSGGGDPSDGTSGDGGSGSTDDGDSTEPSDRRARMTAGSPVELANGLVGRPITPNLTSGVRSCSIDPCPAVRR